MSQFYNALESLIPGEVVITITGNDGTPEPGVNNNFNIVTANATPQFKGTAGTETLDFGLTNLLLGSSGPSIIAGAAENTAVGILAGNGLTTGELNVFVGTSAGSHVDVGEYNTIIGANAGATFLGSGNTVVGGAAFTNAITANNNIIIGKFAGTNIGLDSNIMIGNAGAAPLTDANTIRIGTQGTGAGQQNSCYIAGIVGVTASSPEIVTINSSTGQLGVTATLSPSLGGTGAATFTAHGVLIGEGTSAIVATAVGATGTVLIGNTGADPTFSATPSLTSVTFPSAGGSGTTPTTDTQSAYEFGTFVPTFDGAVSGTTSYSSQDGFYVKIGNLVTVCGTIVITAATGTGNAQLGALPFTSNSGTGNASTGTIKFSASGWTWPTGGVDMVLQISAGATIALLETIGSTKNSQVLQMTNAAASFTFNLSYMV